MIRTNFHTHTAYCDGKNSVREMIEAAIAGGFSALGFSGHSMVSADPEEPCYCMTHENEARYRKEVLSLKEEYAGRIRVYCGIEQDLYADRAPEGYDFVLGSVHYVQCDGDVYVVDYSADFSKNTIDTQYGGDSCAYAEDYYRNIIRLCADPKADIVGHFDLLTKFNEQQPLIDESSPRYIAAWNSALEAVAESGKFMEINSGAIPRGYRTTCYPAPQIMKRALELKIPLLLSCDCHSAESLLSGW